jgi:hypothetical protein
LAWREVCGGRLGNPQDTDFEIGREMNEEEQKREGTET